MSEPQKPRSVVAEFHKKSSDRLELFSLIVVEDRGDYLARTTYDVDYSKQYGYIFHQSGGGGAGPVPISGIYFVGGAINVKVKESPCQLVSRDDRPPWRGKKTRIIRERNKTRRLRSLPNAFDMKPGWDLLDWLQWRAIQEDAVYCSICRDHVPGDTLCEHVWWCEKAGWYSTDREGQCECKSQDECSAHIAKVA